MDMFDGDQILTTVIQQEEHQDNPTSAFADVTQLGRVLLRSGSILRVSTKSIDFAEVQSAPACPDELDLPKFLHDFDIRLKSLTKKELAVLDYILQGETNKSISLKFDLTQRAVELRKASVLKKLQARSHTELVRRMTKYEVLRDLVLRPFSEWPLTDGDQATNGG